MGSAGESSGPTPLQGVIEVSAGLRIPGTAYASPTVIDHGGTFSGNTCQTKVPVSVMGCGSNVPSAVFVIKPENVSQSQVLHVSSGFAVVVSDGEHCAFGMTECDAGDVSSTIQGSVSSGAALYVSVVGEDGGCGPFVLDALNASACSDPTNASTCVCGDASACASDQSCVVAADLSGSCSL